MTQKVTVAILGATGMVGETLASVLHERQFPASQIFALASARSEGGFIPFGTGSLEIQDAAHFDFSTVDLAFFSAGGAASLHYVPLATAAGCVVIDNTSAFRYEPDVPLVVPEVNPECIADYKKRNLIANPNCSTIQMLVALKPLYDRVGIHRIHVNTYQSVSGAGRLATEELARQTVSLLNGKGISDPAVFSKQIAFNVLPHIDHFQDNGYTKEEMKMVWETQKILKDTQITINPTTVRVPVFYGHSESVHIQTKRPLTPQEAKDCLRAAPGVALIEEDDDYPTAVTHASGTDPVYVGRIRQDLNDPCGLNLWIVSDNIRKGAALNSVQIAELWLKLLS